MQTQIPAGEFKAHCLQLMDEVAATGQTLIITKRGKPVAKLVPLEPVVRERRPGSAKGKLKRMSADFDAPLDDFRDYM